MKDRIKTVFLLPSIGGGGAEMNVVRIANHLDRSSFEPIIAAGRAGGAFEKRLQQDVRVKVLCDGPMWSSTGRLVRALPAFNRLVHEIRPHIVCAGLEHAALLASASLFRRGSWPAYVACVQNAIRPLSWPYRFALRCALQEADRVVALSAGVSRELTAWLPTLAARLEMIPNAAIDDAVLRMSQEPLHHPRPTGPLLLACGRLTRQKGFDLLLNACAALPQDSWSQLWILGDGPERDRLIRQAVRLGLKDRVSLLGFRHNPYKYMAAADVFILSSRWEGFANVLVEAMACGCPIVSFDCPHGPAEILVEGEFGVLIAPESPQALAAAIVDLLGNSSLLRHLRNRGRTRAFDFTAARAAEQYGRCFEMAVTERDSPRLQ
jgi:glycosyltransferase involved in cell wall biosynthesis